MLSWSQPYPSRRSPVFGRNAVATSQPLATQAGIEILHAGGNAADAAVATAITLTVVEPNNNGVGSDAFALVWDGAALHGLNASGRSPAGWTPERFAGHSSMPVQGWDSVTVPGAVSAWRALSERYGRLPFEQLFTRAIHYARSGFHVGPRTAYYWGHAARTLGHHAGFRSHFLPDGRAPATGTLFVREDLAHTLEDIATTAGESFYRGDLAAAIAAQSRREGGAMNAGDLAAHRCDWVDPISAEFAGHRLHEIPPNGQGLAALIAVSLLQHLGVPEDAPDGPHTVHLQIECMKRAIVEAFRHIADPQSMHVPASELLTPTTIATWAASIDPGCASDLRAELPTAPDTVYLTTADADGMMVSMIQSNYLGFGSGIVIEGTGIALQNRGSGFSLLREHPNRVGPRKRPFHTIIPGFVTGPDGAAMAFGVMGGHMQPQGHLQMVTRVFAARQNPQAASDAPRWHVYPTLDVGVETGFDSQVVDALRALGHTVRHEPAEHVFGGAQAILRQADGSYCAASDHRKEGQAAAF